MHKVNMIMQNENILLSIMESIPIVDTHEHIPNECIRLTESHDFYGLYAANIGMDLINAGMSKEKSARLASAELSPGEKWDLFAPYYDLLRNSTPARCSEISIKKLFGMEPLRTREEAEELSHRLKDFATPGFYDKVIRDICGIERSIRFGYGPTDKDYIPPVMYVSQLADLNKIEQITDNTEFMNGKWPSSLAMYVANATAFLERQKAQGVIGIKLDPSYRRPYDIASVTDAAAQHLYNRILDSRGWRSAGIGYDEAIPLQDYLINVFVGLASELDMTVIFHTGFQIGHYHDLEYSRPEKLGGLLNRYRTTRFILLHCGYPWVEEAAAMARHFPNLWLDLTWVHSMSDEIAARAVRTFVDIVPRNKVLGFGGDYYLVENIYGHLEMAKHTIAKALAAKINDGALTLEDATLWCRAMLHDNAYGAYPLMA